MKTRSASGDRECFSEQTALLRPAGDHELGAVSRSQAVVDSEVRGVGVYGTITPLAGPISPTVVPYGGGEFYGFVPLEPNVLLNTVNQKFYRWKPLLQRTALPAPLAPVEHGFSRDDALHVLTLK